MNWMEDQGVLLDTFSQYVHTNFSHYGFMSLHLMDHESLIHTMNHTEAKSLADLPVACEYPDVFLV